MYAVGAGSHLFSGTIEQTYIAHAIAYAACIGSEANSCEQPHRDDASAPAISQPLYPRQKQTSDLFGLASPPVEEMKHVGNLWGISSSKSGSSCSKLFSIYLLPIVWRLFLF